MPITQGELEIVLIICHLQVYDECHTSMFSAKSFCEAHQHVSTVLRNHCEKKVKRERQLISKCENFKKFCLCGWVAQSFSFLSTLLFTVQSFDELFQTFLYMPHMFWKLENRGRFRWEIVVQLLLGNTSYVKGINVNVGNIYLRSSHRQII